MNAPLTLIEFISYYIYFISYHIWYVRIQRPFMYIVVTNLFHTLTEFCVQKFIIVECDNYYVKILHLT